jgi:hypothetical protein
MEENGLFEHMCKEAQNELASGEKSWKEIDPNTLILACFGMLTNHLTHKLTKPLWFFASSVAAGVIGYLIKLVLG